MVVIPVAIAVHLVGLAHVAVRARPVKFRSALVDILAVLSVTVDFVLQVLLGLVDALFAIAPLIGPQGQCAADDQDSAKHGRDCCLSGHIQFPL